MADLLALHTDYSLWESFLRLDAIEKVANPNFPQVLFENAANSYCMSHQYELARHLYAPRAHRFAAHVQFGDPFISPEWYDDFVTFKSLRVRGRLPGRVRAVGLARQDRLDPLRDDEAPG